jgi:hypothetical protein
MYPASIKSAEDILGFEYDWLASDAEGHVALFSTAGTGYVPGKFLQDTAAHDAAINAILQMPAITQASFAPEIPPPLNNTWKQVAERGLYAFDCDPGGGPYRLVAAPVVPRRVEELPARAGDTAAHIAFRALRFRDHSTLTEDVLRESE